MRIRKHWIALLVVLAFLAAGCSQTPKVIKIAGTIVDEQGRPVPKAALVIGSSMAQTSTAGHFTISAPTGENKAVLLVKGCRPQIIHLTLGEEPQTLTLTARREKPSRHSGSTVDYLLLIDSLRKTDIPSGSDFTYLTGAEMRETALIHAGIIDLETAVQYLSPAAMRRLCDILKVRHIVWIQKDLDNHLQVFSARSGRITNLPFEESKGVARLAAPLANLAKDDSRFAEEKPRGIEANLANEVKSYMEQLYDVTYTGRDIRRIERVAGPVIAVSERPNLQFTFGILETKEYNAYALPGGYIYITRPLLEMLESDDELAAVLAHESAHITHVHAVKSYERQVALTVAGIFLAVATGNAETSFDFVRLIGNIITEGYSKEQEYDADRTGLRYISRAGYDPEAMVSLLTKLRDLEYRLTGGRQGYSRTHPATQNRIKQVQSEFPTIEYYRFIDQYLLSL
ncbi:MAG: M48 family metalloprotease [Firmicutes bacterium]|nr:M48 family metalloprotease [Bacillota bacterium]